MEMLPGVTVIQRGWLSSNMVLAADEAGLAVVDTGYCAHADQTVALVESAAQGHPRGPDLSLRVVNTHLHSDHCGGNSAIRQRWPHVRIGIPPGSADAVDRWEESQLTYRITGQRCPAFQADFRLHPSDGLRLAGRDWQILPAPGHDPDSVVLFEPASATLISADALWSNGFGVVFPELQGEPGFDEVGATLDMIESLQPQWVIPGHGAPFTDVAGALRIARSKLQAFRADPARHAVHAAKVLLVFRVLESVQMAPGDLVHWAQATPYLHTIHQRIAGHSPFDAWVSRLLQSLIDTGGLRLDGKHLSAAKA